MTKPEKNSGEYYEEEAKKFVAAHPDYVPNSANRDALFDRLQQNHLSMNRRTLRRVFEELKAEGKLELRTEGE